MNKVILLIAAIALVSCSVPTMEDRYEAVQTLYPTAIVLSNPERLGSWIVIDTTGPADYYIMCSETWHYNTKVTNIIRLYTYPLNK